jgi:hypothetical protein
MHTHVFILQPNAADTVFRLLTFYHYDINVQLECCQYRKMPRTAAAISIITFVSIKMV